MAFAEKIERDPRALLMVNEARGTFRYLSANGDRES